MVDWRWYGEVERWEKKMLEKEEGGGGGGGGGR